MSNISDYSELAKIKTAKQKKEEKDREIITKDIQLIEEALKSDDEEFVRDTHRRIDGMYQACIKRWEFGMYAFHLEHGFIYDNLDMESLKDNLAVMRPKLQAYLEGWNAKAEDDFDKNNVSVVVNNTNNLSIAMTFEEAKQKIEEMEGLTQEETDEIQKKIDELESISREKTSKKKKWAKVKPILEFALDKSVDVAVMLWSLCIQKSLGM